MRLRRSLTRSPRPALWSLINTTRSGSLVFLDCGSGHGSLVGELRIRGIDAVGIEISR
jgi:hypothetical protein